MKYLSKICGDVKVKEGKVYEYLVMALDYSITRQVQISMTPYIQNVIDAFPEPITTTAFTPAGDYLFQV